MSDITMIGLGAMGSALAHAFAGAGHDLVVWNRTMARTAPLVARGATAIEHLADAVGTSPVVAICIDNYGATRTLLDDVAVMARLEGKTLIQFSTGTPREARSFRDWLSPLAVQYIDSAIMGYPDSIGSDDSPILFAGPQSAFGAVEPMLRCLGGDLRYLGENPVAAAAMDMALLTHELCGDLAVLHAANLCAAEGIGVDALAAMFPAGHPGRKLAALIHEGRADGLGATISVWNGAIERMREQATDAGINREVPDFIASFFQRAIASGWGEEDIPALIKVLKSC